jgi:bacitracin transport system permease protein
LYTLLLIGVPLYGVVTAYLFNREFLEDTLKNLLTIPVSRTRLIISKIITLFIWIMLLTIVAWVLALLLGMLGQFKGLNPSLIVNSLGDFATGGILLFILSTPIIFIAVLTNNFVPTIILSIVIILINVISGSSEHRGLFPWAAAVDIANDTLPTKYPAEISYIAISVTAIFGLIATILYLKNTDIH